ncbi:MAG: glycosyltransferase [Sphingosinicella sp.]
MRIVYPVNWSTLGRQACREQTVRTAAALARRGHELTLLMPRRPGDAELDADRLRDHFHVTGDFRVAQRPSRWVGESLFTGLAWLEQLRRDPLLEQADIVYSRMPAMLGAGHLSPLPFVTESYRLWLDELPSVGPLLRRTARAPHCLGLILHSAFAAASYRRAGLDPARLLVAHNGADAARALGAARARGRLGLPRDRSIALYAGRIGPQKGLDQVLALADLRPDVLFVLVGSEGEGMFEREAASRGNVQVVGWAAPDALPAWLQAADILLIPPARAPLEKFRTCVLPMKTFSYLAAGRPILAPALPDTVELLRHKETAWLVPPDQPGAAAAALDRLLQQPALARRLGANARRLASGLSWDARAERISAFLEERLVAAEQSIARQDQDRLRWGQLRRESWSLE